MKEEFLHYVWQYKKFELSNLTTVAGESVVVRTVGSYLQQAGPDFFNAQLVIGGQRWAGNVEMHLKSSDWYLHQHELDPNYDTVILHVVWEHDVDVYRKDNTVLPVLELKHYVTEETLSNYYDLTVPKTWIYCEQQLAQLDSFVWKNWSERVFFERLEQKAVLIQKLLRDSSSDWEAVLFWLLAKNFGLNTNGDSFLRVAQSIPFSVVRKESHDLLSLEALFLGSAGLIPAAGEDVYTQSVHARYVYLCHKYQLVPLAYVSMAFFQHRPDNFPTIRFVQLAGLYYQQRQLFEAVLQVRTRNDATALFRVSVSEYWQTHYQFDVRSVMKRKALSTSFVDLLLINTLVPLRFAYAQSMGNPLEEQLVELMQSIPAEKNIIIEKFATFGIRAQHAFESQSLLQLKQVYCAYGKCLGCGIGLQLLKS
jgi:hypothetical protein